MISLVRDSGLTFSPGTIEKNSCLHEVFTETVSFAVHLYVPRGFSWNSAFESILSEFILSWFLSLLTQ